MPKTKTADMKIEHYSASLKVLLTAEEIADRADRAAGKIADRDEKEEEAKAANKHAKSVIEAIDAEIRRLSNEVRTRSSYRETECERRLDFAAGTITETRLDTSEVLLDRQMTDGERQRQLPFAGESEDNGDDNA